MSLSDFAVMAARTPPARACTQYKLEQEEYEQEEHEWDAEGDWDETMEPDVPEEVDVDEWWDGTPVEGDSMMVWAKVPKGIMINYTPTKGTGTPAQRKGKGTSGKTKNNKGTPSPGKSNGKGKQGALVFTPAADGTATTMMVPLMVRNPIPTRKKRRVPRSSRSSPKLMPSRKHFS